ncbi:MAG TPA: GNAT family protein [Candidatus Methanofastidiosa archaeon]|nr:GNAT family protein [Candidatus Methanofastidiosa archaeon]HPR42277.1 GNAT family protein [Candidatus Methanofastidiosa archaeon]
MEGRLVKLRPVEQRDAETLFLWYNGHDVMDLMDMDLSLDLARTMDMIAKGSSSNTFVGFMIDDKKTGVAIGVTTLNDINWTDRKADFSILMGGKDYWSSGHVEDATRLLLDHAFCILDLHRVSLETCSQNLGAIQCHEKCGFIREGTLRKARYWRCERHDIIPMSILSDDFREGR